MNGVCIRRDATLILKDLLSCPSRRAESMFESGESFGSPATATYSSQPLQYSGGGPVLLNSVIHG